MKKILLILMLAFSVGAMASNKDKKAEPKPVAHEFAYTIIHSEDGNGTTKNDTLQAKKKEAPLASQLAGEGSRSDISVYIVDFINRNNIKLAKKVLKD